MLNLIYETLVKGQGNLKELEDQLSKNVKDSYDKMSKEKATIKDRDEYVKQTVDGAIKQFSSKWMRYFMSYDPSYALEKVTCRC